MAPSQWVLALPPNLTTLHAPFASATQSRGFSMPEDFLNKRLLQLSKLTSLDLSATTSQLSLPPTLTWLKSNVFDPRALELPHLKTYDLIHGRLTWQILIDIYEARRLTLNVLGGIFYTNGDASSILHICPVPAPDAGNKAVITHYWKHLLQAFPLWQNGHRSDAFEQDILLEFRAANGSSLV